MNSVLCKQYMNPKLKAFLVAFAKQAVNAALVSLTPVIATPSSYNLTTKSGLGHVALLVGGAVISRELLVWIPMVMKWSQTAVVSVFLFVLMAVGLAGGQTPTPAPTAFSDTTISFNLTPITLPGAGSSVAGAETDITLNLTTNNQLAETNLIGGNYAFIGGRFNRVIPQISKALNNASANLNGLAFQFGVTGSLGVVKSPSTLVLGGTQSHWGQRAGVFVNYAINGTWGLGFESQWCNLPGFVHTSYSIAFGPNFHF